MPRAKTANPVQRMEALAMANKVRQERATLRKQVADGDVSLADLIEDPPDVILRSSRSNAHRAGDSSEPQLLKVLLWGPGWGRERAKHFLDHMGLSHTLLLGDLSPKSRKEVSSVLRAMPPGCYTPPERARRDWGKETRTRSVSVDAQLIPKEVGQELYDALQWALKPAGQRPRDVDHALRRYEEVAA